MITTNQLRNGITIEYEGVLYTVLEFQHVKPGKGQAFVRTKLRNVKTGAVIDKTFRAGEKIEQARVERREMQYLYKDGKDFYFMDNESFDQFSLNEEFVGEAAKYIVENMNVYIDIYEGKPLSVEAPTFVELAVTHTEPGLKGDTATAGTKPATVETGFTLQVPLFIEKGDKIKIDTRTGEYITRIT